MKNKWKLKKGSIIEQDGVKTTILQVVGDLVFCEWKHGDRHGKDWNTLDYWNGLDLGGMVWEYD